MSPAARKITTVCAQCCGNVPRADLGASVVRIHRVIRLAVLAARIGAVVVLPALARSSGAGGTADRFHTSRTFNLGAGNAVREFTFRERSGVIIVNRLTVPRGVRAFVDARIPGIAGAGVSTWLRHSDPSLSCRSVGASNVCTQAEEWCPMPSATWRFRLVKLGGPAGPIRFDYLVAAPPSSS
jgi:hypothetical protein